MTERSRSLDQKNFLGFPRCFTLLESVGEGLLRPNGAR